MAGSPERKIRILGREIDPGYVSIAGLYTILAGICSRNEKVLFSAMLLGMGLMAYGTYKMEQENQKTPPS